MSQEKKYDTVARVLMGTFAGAADAFTLLALLMFAFPVVGVVMIGLAIIANLFTVCILVFWFIMKGEKNLMVWAVNMIGATAGLLLPVKFIWIIIATMLGNSQLARKLALEAALIAATVATGGAAAPAAVGEIAGKKAAETGVRAMARRAAIRAGRRKIEEGLVEGGQDRKKREEWGRVSEQELGVERDPFEEMQALAEEVQDEESGKFIDITGRRKKEGDEKEEWREAA